MKIKYLVLMCFLVMILLPTVQDAPSVKGQTVNYDISYNYDYFLKHPITIDENINIYTNELIIICFDAGHFSDWGRYGIKPNGENYSEAEGMKALADALSLTIPNSVFTRLDENDVSFTNRSEFAFNNNADVIISLHSNGNPQTEDESVPGVVVLYSVAQQENRIHAEKLAELLTKYTGIPTSNIGYWENDNPGEDQLAMIRKPVELGIKQVYIVEHGSHWQFAGDYDNNIEGCVKAYLEFYEYLMNKE
jgi:N-acetylmuramoyl-L-alanine amidase